MRVEEVRGAFMDLVGKSERKRPLGIARHRWEDRIVVFTKWDGGVMDWIYLAHDRNRWRALVNAVMNLWLPLNAGDSLTS